MRYYKIYPLDSDTPIGVVTTDDFREYINDRMFIASRIRNANFFSFEGKLYRAMWMKKVKELEDRFPTVSLTLISKEEYDDFLNSKTDEENLNENN